MSQRKDLPKPTNNPNYIRIKQQSKDLMVRVVRNNRALLKAAGMTFKDQSDAMNVLGLYVNRKTLWAFENYSHYDDAKLSFICMIANYWGKPVWEFISVDYSLASENASKLPDPRKNSEVLNEFL